MDKKGKKSFGAPVVTKSSKRKHQCEDSGRPKKKRIYVLVDKDWGHRNSNKGLDCLKEDQCREYLNLQDQPGPLKTRTEPEG